MRIEDWDMAQRLFCVLDYWRSFFYIQKFVPHRNEDYRAFVLGGEVIASMRRKGEYWKTNFAQGAKVMKITLPDELEDMAVKAAEALMCEYAGVDILPGKNENYIIEVNSIPGWKGLQNVTDFCIGKKIVDYFLH